MINSQELLNILHINGLDNISTLESVNNILDRLQYSDADKQEALHMLKAQGWILSATINAAEPLEKIRVMPVVPDGGSQAVIPPHKSHKVLLFSIIILIIIGAGLAYIYLEKIGPFSPQKYTEDNFFSGLLGKFGQIDSSTYTMSGSLSVAPRDKDAVPFAIKEVSNAVELRQQYYYDTERLKDASSILSRLNSLSGYYSYGNSKGTVQKSYPASVKNIYDKSGYYGSSSITDPETNKEYEYQVTDGGKNFLLTVNFETDTAIKAIRGYGYSATSTIISGKKVSFTKDSSNYMYMSSEPPKPFLVEMGDSMGTFPSDLNIKGSISVSSDLKTVGMADWLFNIDAEGDFGDLTYKINADALKKDDNYYFRVNNIPSLFLMGDLGTIKGKWVSVSSKVASSTDEENYSELSSLRNSLPEMEKAYKNNREKSIKFIKKLVSVADEEKLITFKNTPNVERVNGQQLVRYELGLKKEKILPFYQKMQTEIDKDPDFSNFKGFVDQGLVDYLQSQEFDEVFSYLDKNNTLVLWTDIQGFPAIIENTMRIVPPDSALQLKDKQVNVVFKMVISDINKALDIKAPAGSITIEKLISDFDNGSISEARLKGKSAALKSQLSSIRAQSELVYDTNSSYGKTPFTLGPCKETAGTLFGDSGVTKLLNAATGNDMSKATCVSKGTTGKVSSYAVSAPLPDIDGFSWCVDSTGNSKQIIGVLKSDVCK